MAGSRNRCRTLRRSQFTALLTQLEKRLIRDMNGKWKSPQSCLNYFQLCTILVAFEVQKGQVKVQAERWAVSSLHRPAWLGAWASPLSVPGRQPRTAKGSRRGALRTPAPSSS